MTEARISANLDRPPAFGPFEPLGGLGRTLGGSAA